MKHVVIAAHPNPTSFTMTMAQAYLEVAAKAGHEAVLRDLYRMKFNPVMPLHELPWAEDAYRDPVVEAEHRLLANADVFVFVYPFWFNAPPAILKGYMERIFCADFAYKPTSHGNEPLLGGRSMCSFTSSGAPNDWLIKTGGLDSSRKLFDEHFAAVCGLKIADHVHFGGITPGIRPDVVDKHVAQIQISFGRSFNNVDTKQTPKR